MTFEYVDPDGDKLVVTKSIAGRHGLSAFLRTEWAETGTGAGVFVPAQDIEEVVRGLRESVTADATRYALTTTEQPERTPCSTPGPCEDGELCGRHEEQRAHTEGDHSICGPTCEVEFPSELLRNTILARAIPGSTRMLDELLRRASAGRPAEARTDRATVLREAADALDESETLRDLTDDHMHDVNAAANELRRMAAQKDKTS
ncbi:hypothetical protein [Streptomyces gardneri]|uniref:hypothetical protein n=1 Tax=Streptomyces gardneri TaxID=66892 RepID=UPI0035D88AC3